MAFEPEQIFALQLTATVSGAVSIVGASLLIACFLLFKELRTYHSKLIVMLSLADLGEAIGWILSTGADNGIVCTCQGIILQFFALSAILWQTCISVYILQVNMNKSDLEKQEIIYHCIAWGLPAIAVIGGTSVGIYGRAGPWCWIIPQYSAVGLGVLYIPFIILMVFNVSAYAWVVKLLRGQYVNVRNSIDQESTSKELARLKVMKKQWRTRFYLIPYLVGWTFAIMNRTYSLVHQESNVVLFGLHASFFPLQGFWNFLMYGLTERLIMPATMEDVLAKPRCRDYFRKFLQSRYCEEGLDFYLEVEKLHSVPFPTPEWTTAALSIRQRFLLPDSPQEINISSGLRQQFEKGDIQAAPFKKAQAEVYDIMEALRFAFSKTKHFEIMMDELKQDEVMIGQIEGGKLLFVLLLHKIKRIFSTKSAYSAMKDNINASRKSANDLDA